MKKAAPIDFLANTQEKTKTELTAELAHMSRRITELEEADIKRKVAEAALQQSEEKYRNLVEGISDVIFEVTEEGFCTYISPKMKDVLGFDPEEKINEHFQTMFHSDDIQKAFEGFARHKSGDTTPVELRMLNKKGEPVWVSLLGRLVKNEDKNFFRGNFRDITQIKKVEEALRESENKYRSLFESASEATFIMDVTEEHGARFLDCNNSTLKLFGCTHRDQIIGKTPDIFSPPTQPDGRSSPEKASELAQAVIEGYPKSFEWTHQRLDGTPFWVEVDLNRVEIKGKYLMQAVAHDVTQRKHTEDREKLTTQTLELLNQPSNKTDVIREVLELIKESLGFEAVAIRLNDIGDYPYYETNGFPADFVEAERYLCGRDTTGQILRDADDRPVLECMCGNVILGRTDPSLPFFTEAGSFWSNCTTELLASTTEEDRQTRTRNRCNAEGYESVALIPLRSAGDIVGLLQLNDSRREMFTLEMINYLEKLGASIGIAFARKLAEEALRESEERFRSLVEATSDWIWETNQDGSYTYASPRIKDLLGYEPEEIIGKTPFDLMPPAEAERVNAIFAEVITSRSSLEALENTNVHKDGHLIVLETSAMPIFDSSRNFQGYRGIDRDITKRKQAEEKLRRITKAIESSNEGIGISDARGNHFYQNQAFTRLFEYSAEELAAEGGGPIVYADKEFDTSCDNR